MRFFRKVLVLSVIMVPLIIGSCKKQDKCGCDGDMLSSFEGTPVRVYYDVDNNSAFFVPLFDSYSTYYFCNPTPMMEKLSQFEYGAEVLIDCEFFWECNYMYQASNSYYGSIYKKYMAEVTDVREDLYGNK
jgi:hypothetical protein